MWKYQGIEFFSLLARHEIPFVIVGGHACNIYAPPRSTEDVDVVWMRSAESARRLLEALREANACWISNERDPNTRIEKLVPVTAAYINCEHIMMLVTDYGFADLVDFIPGMPTENVQQLYDQSVIVADRRYASLEWLKKMKQAAGRPRDLEDLRNLP